MFKKLLLGVALLMSLPLHAAPADDTNAGYNTTAGCCASGAVILQSTDGLGATAVNSSHPLQVGGTVSTTPASATTAGPTSITAAQCSTLSSLNSIATASVLVTGTWTGTLTAYTSVDGTTFASPVPLVPQVSGLSTTGITANGTWTFSTAGMSSAKVCGNTVASGTAVVSLRTNTGANSAASAVAALAGSTTSPSTAEVSVLPGIANAAAPTLTEARQSPLSLTLTGGLRVDGSGVVLSPGASVTGADGTSNSLVMAPQSAAGTNQTSGLLVANKWFNGTTWDEARGTTAGVFMQGGVASGASDSGNPVKQGGVFNTTQPTVTTGQRVDAQMTARGAQIVAAGVDGFAVTQATGTNLHAVLDTTSTTAVTQATGTNLHAVIDSGSTTAATQATAANLNAQVQGAVASGSADSGNPVKIGGTFNTTQPTVTNGQRVDDQMTARGAQIVAAGVEGLSVSQATGTNLHAVLDTTSTTAVTQATAANLNATVTPAVGTILDGQLSLTASGGPTTFLTVPSGKTWIGTIAMSASCQEIAAGTASCVANGTITTAGTSVTPAAGTYLVCDARSGANAATGTVGSQSANFCSVPFIEAAPGGNSVTIQLTTAQAGTLTQVHASAIGTYQ